MAVITGGGGGIGKAMGERFAREGMKVVLADVDSALLDATVAELRDRSHDVTGVATDVSDMASVEQLRDATLSTYGAVHLVCNNAGIGSGSEGQLWQHHLNDWRWSMDVNVYGVIHGINAFVPVMLEQGVEGHIVNTSSGNGGFYPLANSAIYATTKAAVVTITECLWGQLHAIDAPISASVLFPSGRTPGMLNTGIWRPGRNRPAKYAREGADPAGRDALATFVDDMTKQGIEVRFAPLEEVADLALQGVRDDIFWIHVPGERTTSMIEARTQSILDRSPPDYLKIPLTPPRASRSG
ncbi:MAG TPA: SDR family NAD(P)-dependent oxidoreductase [Acidimicrobiales bacterium]|nr:SDR family NAD(P)-dependent oxidoreductase [Acidimicrobiales bacterium]